MNDGPQIDSVADIAMKALYREVIQRFPEIKASVEYESDLPYLVVGGIVEWLLSIARPKLSAEIIQRVVDFDRWCMAQPRGETAENDISTVETIALREKLFEHDELLPIIPHLMSREELLRDKNHLTQWVGADRYELALRYLRK